MILSKHVIVKAIILILSTIAIAGLVILEDLHRLNNDFERLYSLLRTARLDAFYENTTIIVRFNGTVVTVNKQNNLKSMTTTAIPTITKVDYDTVTGKNTIVYDMHGTSRYNKRIHGGEIMLKSMLGFKKYLHVNCNGVVMEGRYPEEK